MTDVKKSVFGCEIYFVAIYALFGLNYFVAIYALLCGKKLRRKLYRWRKNDKYEVCLGGWYYRREQTFVRNRHLPQTIASITSQYHSTQSLPL